MNIPRHLDLTKIFGTLQTSKNCENIINNEISFASTN